MHYYKHCYNPSAFYQTSRDEEIRADVQRSHVLIRSVCDAPITVWVYTKSPGAASFTTAHMLVKTYLNLQNP